MDDYIYTIIDYIDKLKRQRSYASELVARFAIESNLVGYGKALQAYVDVSKDLDEANEIYNALSKARDITAECWKKHGNTMDSLGIII